MGMSASQARYLSLTARKSDLEFRGQQINQSRLMLSNQSANLYSSMLSMSVPTPPVETDFMKDVYSFSMGGDNTTLSSYKLSMGKDGYGYDILYSKPATSRQLAASSSSNVQRVINRQAASETSSSFPLKIKTTYDNSKPQSKSSPNVSRLVTVSSPITYSDVSDNIESEYKNLWAYLAGDSANRSKPKDPSYCSSYTNITDKSKININTNTNTNNLTYNDKPYNKVSQKDLINIFGCSFDGTSSKFNDCGALKNIIVGDAQFDTHSTDKLSAYQFYINAKDMKLMVINTAAANTSEKQNMMSSSNLSNNAVVKEYDLAAVLGLKLDNSINIQNENKQKVYYQDTKQGSSSTRNYYTFSMKSADNNTCNFQYRNITNDVSKADYKIDDHKFYNLTESQLNNFGITENKSQNVPDTQNKKEYQYFRDSSNGDIWECCTTTDTNGGITESWKLFQANKTYNIGEKEAQLIDEKDWPSGIIHTQQNGEYDCYYVPDETGTGGSYYLIAKPKDTYTATSNEVQVNNDIHKYDANNTYKIEGMTACIISSSNIPSTILDAYDQDQYVVYATYNDKDTDFSDPVKYYVYPKDDEAAEAVCAYTFEKSYTGKNEIIEGRANILVDENGRLSKINILNQGTYALEYGQEKDEEAYNEAYREYEYKLEKYEKEMADIDARTAIIQQQDKKLELQLKSIDTEHSAIQTELEALKKVIDNNIKSGFGTFGG